MTAETERTKLALAQSLAARPVRNQLVRERDGTDGAAVLVVPRKEAWWVRLLGVVFHIPKEHEVSLDKVGTWVWHQCSGEESVEQITAALAAEFELDSACAQSSLLQYLRVLARRRLIGFVVSSDAAGTEP